MPIQTGPMDSGETPVSSKDADFALNMAKSKGKTDRNADKMLNDAPKIEKGDFPKGR